MLSKPHPTVNFQIDDVVFEDEVISNNGELRSSLAESKNLDKFG